MSALSTHHEPLRFLRGLPHLRDRASRRDDTLAKVAVGYFLVKALGRQAAKLLDARRPVILTATTTSET